MNEPTNLDVPSTDIAPVSPSPIRCLSGAVISGGFALALYYLTQSIAQTFAAKPIHSANPAVLNIASAVRTLVVGMSALGTGIFGLVTLGLVGLAIQILIGQLIKKPIPDRD